MQCRLKRAGLDYWPFVVVQVHDSWQVRTLLMLFLGLHDVMTYCDCGVQAFYSYFQQQPDPKRLFGYSKYGMRHYAEPGRCLLLLCMLRPDIGTSC